jgi:hypothetical protein
MDPSGFCNGSKVFRPLAAKFFMGHDIDGFFIYLRDSRKKVEFSRRI